MADINVKVLRSEDDSSAYDLYINGKKWLEGERFAVCDNVAAALMGHHDNSECAELAENILSIINRDAESNEA